MLDRRKALNAMVLPEAVVCHGRSARSALGGEFFSVFNGPNGERFDTTGIYLLIEPPNRLVSTDALLPGWIPSERAFMVAESIFDQIVAGKTNFTFRTMHWNEKR